MESNDSPEIQGGGGGERHQTSPASLRGDIYIYIDRERERVLVMEVDPYKPEMKQFQF